MLYKVAGLMTQDTGVGYYRIGQPVRFIDRALGSHNSKITPFSGRNQPVALGQGTSRPGWKDKFLMEIASSADIVWTNILWDKEEMLKMLDLRKWSGAKWVIDIDDNLYAVSSDNQGQNITRLLKNEMELCLKLADGLTVSVPSLKKLYEPLNDNIYVNPNGIDFTWWKRTQVKHRGIRIGWRGASGHKADIALIEPALRALKKDYNITFVSFGAKPSFESENHEWVDFLEFPKKLDELNLDIAVVPLIDSSYNRCKSNLAILEFSALKIPIVASPTENQKNMPISYAVSNFEWYRELEKLIKDRKLRESQGKEQYKFIHKNYDIKILTPSLIEFFDNLERRKDLEPK